MSKSLNLIQKSFIRKKEAIFLIIATTTIIGLYINFLLPHRFLAQTQILIVQKPSSNIDAYTAIRGAEQIANTLKYVVGSPSFLENIISSPYKIKQSYFPSNPEKKAKQWEKMIVPKVTPNTGILTLNIYHPDRQQAKEIAQGALYVLKQNNEAYFGKGNSISISTLSEPIVSQRYARPHALANTVIGFMCGVLISAGVLWFYPEEKISFNIFTKTPTFSTPENLPTEKQTETPLKEKRLIRN